MILAGFQAVGDWNAAIAQPGGPGQGLSGGMPGQLHPIQVGTGTKFLITKFLSNKVPK
jgi:hypothetical protein